MNWYEYDDTYVKPLPSRDIVSRAAYLLFYQRKKLTHNTLDDLFSKSHWVYGVAGSPRSWPQPRSNGSDTLVRQNGKSVDSRTDWREFDSEQYYVNKVNLNDIEQPKHESRDRNTGTLRPGKSDTGTLRPGKSDTYTEKSTVSDEEKALLDELRRDVSPRVELKDPWSLEELQSLNIGSARRDDVGINSPRQSVRKEMKESPRKDSGHRVSEADLEPRQKPSVAERIIKSKQSSEHSGKVSYMRSDSVGSNRNNQSFTSGSDTSSPPSPQDITIQINANKQGISLKNNERDIKFVNETVENGVPLKIHTNQIKTSTGSKSGPVKAYDMYDGKYTGNQKVNNSSTTNNTSNKNTPPIPARREIHGTPQQTRKSTPPPNWSTPQPQRKQYSEASKPSYSERQFSVPPRNSKPGSNVDSKRLEVEGRNFEGQPRSLPSESRSYTDKPPLPGKPTPSSRIATLPVGSTQDFRPSSGRGLNNSGGPSKGSGSANGRPASAYEPRGEHTSRRSHSRSEVRTRNSSADRHQGNYLCLISNRLKNKTTVYQHFAFHISIW